MSLAVDRFLHRRCEEMFHSGSPSWSSSSPCGSRSRSNGTSGISRAFIVVDAVVVVVLHVLLVLLLILLLLLLLLLLVLVL